MILWDNEEIFLQKLKGGGGHLQTGTQIMHAAKIYWDNKLQYKVFLTHIPMTLTKYAKSWQHECKKTEKGEAMKLSVKNFHALFVSVIHK